MPIGAWDRADRVWSEGSSMAPLGALGAGLSEILQSRDSSLWAPQVKIPHPRFGSPHPPQPSNIATATGLALQWLSGAWGGQPLGVLSCLALDSETLQSPSLSLPGSSQVAACGWWAEGSRRHVGVSAWTVGRLNSQQASHPPSFMSDFLGRVGWEEGRAGGRRRVGGGPVAHRGTHKRGLGNCQVEGGGREPGPFSGF